MKKINRKIPGILPPPPKTEIDGKISDLSSKTVSELLELHDRQLKLLKNSGFISKLPDKGEKILAFNNKIVEALKSKKDEDQARQMLENLKLNGIDTLTIQDVEWEGEVGSKNEVVLDSDDDSEPEDVMQILSQNTALERKVKVLQPEKPLLTPEYLEKIGEVPHVKYILDKTEKNPHAKAQSGQFKPYKSTKSDVHNPEKEMLRTKGKHWEVTAATPPPSVHGPAKILNIEESLQLQQEYNRHMKEIEAQHAAEKLVARMNIKMAELPEDTSKFGAYREVDSEAEGTDNEGSDKEVHDDDEPDRGGVVFTVLK